MVGLRGRSDHGSSKGPKYTIAVQSQPLFKSKTTSLLRCFMKSPRSEHTGLTLQGREKRRGGGVGGVGAEETKIIFRSLTS